jgi:hypothetical protein
MILNAPKITGDMKRPTNEEVENAFRTLILAGRFSYKVEAEPSGAQCLGQAVSHVSDNCSFLIEAAAEHCEDWNGHSLAKHLRDLASGKRCVPAIS